jgi:superfamily II DNA/RNA helicase
MLFDSFELDRRLLRAINAMGFEIPTPVQAEAVPFARKGRDVMACARTGSGKTAAFGLPSIQRLLEQERRGDKGPRMLVLCPTRELAAQVHDQLQQIAHYTRLRVGLIVGGEAYPPQIDMLRQNAEVVVGTPGRLIDHMKERRLDLSNIEILVLDEADRMLDMGFIDDVMQMAQRCPEDRQTLFFSATLDGEIDSVANRLVRDPERVETDRSDVEHLNIEEYVLRADNEGHKQQLLLHIVRDPELTLGIIFVGMKARADDQTSLLKQAGHDVVTLHGDLPQSKRSRVIERLRRGEVRLLIATDVAARGLDIHGVSHVINYDLPKTPRDYVHRIGRTGRAGATGVAVSLVTPGEWIQLVDIEDFKGHKLDRRVVPGKEPTRPEAPGRAETSAAGGRKRFGRRGGVRRRQNDDSDD